MYIINIQFVYCFFITRSGHTYYTLLGFDYIYIHMNVPKTAAEFHDLRAHFEDTVDSELRKKLIGYVISAQLNSRQETITGEIIGTHFTIGGERNLKVKVQEEHTSYDSNIGTYIISFDNVTEVHTNPHC